MELNMIPELLVVLKKANSRGELGYAWGGGNKEWPLIDALIRQGYIVYHRDASPGWDSPQYGQKRDIYLLTEKGKEAISSSEPPETNPSSDP